MCFRFAAAFISGGGTKFRVFFFAAAGPIGLCARAEERGGGKLWKTGRTTAKANSITPAHRTLPGVPSKKKVPFLFSQKEGKENLHRRQKQRGTGAKKVQSLFFLLLSTLRGATTMLHTCAPSALDLDNDNNQVQALRTHSSAKVSPTSSSSLLFRLLPIQTFHHPREEGRRMPFSPPPPVKRGPNRLPRRRRKKKAATWGIRMDGPISLMLSPAGGGIYAPSFQLLPPLFSPAPWNRSSPSPLSLQRKVPWGGAGGKKKAAKGGKPK